MRAVRVSRDYQVEIELTVDCEQLGISLASDDTSLLAAYKTSCLRSQKPRTTTTQLPVGPPSKVP